MKPYLLDLYTYDYWANKRILNTVISHGIQGHVANHSTHHWGQVAARILRRQLRII